MSLESRIESIQTRQDLTDFIRALVKDFQDNPKSWENTKLDQYLEATAAWIDDMDGYYNNLNKPVPHQPEWKTIADILMAAKHYE